MNFKYASVRQMILVGLLVLGTSAVLCQNAMAANRLSLFVTQEELTIWRDRANNGPYKTAGDVSTNSPGDWDTIATKAANFLSDPDADRWEGQTSASCVQSWDSALPEDDKSLGEDLMSAAFYYLVKGGTNYRDAVKNELLAQAAEIGTDFSDSTRWCSNLGDSNPTFNITAWMTKLLIGYSFIRSDIPTADQDTLDTWFENAGIYWESIVGKTETLFVDRDNDDYTLSSYGNSVCSSGGRITHYGGYTCYNFSKFWNNRKTSHVRLFAFAGIVTGNTFLKIQAKRYVKEWVRFSTFPDGTPSEFERWTSSHPCLGWGYAATTLGQMIQIADAFARDGDTELYDYSSSEGHCGTSGGPKTFKNNVIALAQYVDHTLMRYGTDQSVNQTSNYLIDSECSGWSSNADSFIALANVYYHNMFVKGIYMRTDAGAPPYPANPAAAGYYVWGGPNGTFPGILFMFGQMEGKVWPYAGGQSSPPKPPTGLWIKNSQE